MANRDEAQSLQLAFSLHRSGNFAEAARLYRKITRRNPREAHALHSLGIIEAAAGNHAEAARLMARSLSVQPNNIPFMQNYATVLCQLGQFETAAAVGMKGLEADRSNVYLLYVVAGARLKQNRLQDALLKFDELLLHQPNHIAGITERSSVLLALKQYDAALAGIERAIALDPHYAEAHLNRGIAYGQLKRHDEAIGAFDRALTLNPNLATAWLGYGNVLFELQRRDEALTAYGKALSLKPDSAEAWLGRGNIFFGLKRYDEAVAAYDKALSFKPDLAEAWLGRGNVFFDLKRYDEAFAAHDKALSFKLDSAKAWVGRGNIFAALKRYDDAFAAYDAALSIDPDLAALEGERLHSRMHLCDWSNFETECDHLVQSVRNGKENTSPFAFLAINSSIEDQSKCAQLWARKRYPAADKPSWHGELYRHDRIRVGYLSADFRQHPVANLVAGVFECHDRSRFEVIGISIGSNDNSDVRRRLEGLFDKFIDAAALGADETATKIGQEEVDILIDLNGLTQNARPEIFARRPAPVQVNYLGYPGTMGAEYIDYIIADPILIPASHRHHYVEKIVYLPHSYMPHDGKTRAISDRPIERAEFGLPENGFVFCCFNNAYKLNPVLFRSRMALLKAVEGSILWLSEHSTTAVNNLRREAIAAGVDPDRLVFAGRLPSSAEHLARHRLADLFLDMLPYNAHATASDALWAGLPVLTQIGGAFAGRVAASLLTAIGLPELITQTQEQFESTAIELATEPMAWAAIKNKLALNRLATPLFNTTLYTRHIESAYATMIERHQNRLLPDHIHVPQQTSSTCLSGPDN
jgi:protein O-GlcNAc transferase